MFRSLTRALVFVACLTCGVPLASAVSPPVAKEIEATRTQLPSVIEFRKRDVDKYLAPTEKLLTNWEKFAARKGLSAEDQAEVDKTTVEVLYTLAHAYVEVGKLDAAEPFVVRAIALAAKLPPSAELEASFAFTIAGKLRRLQGKYAEAAQHLEKAFSIRKSRNIVYWDVTVLLYELAQIRKIQGEFKKSLELLHALDTSVMREAAGSERAGVDLWAGEYKKIEDDLAPALKMLHSNKDLADPILITAFAHLADYHLVLGSPERAEEPAKELLSRRENLPLPNAVDIADALIRLSRVYVALGDADKAASFLARAEKNVLSTSETHVVRVAWQAARAEVLVKQGDMAQAGRYLEGAYKAASAALGPDNYVTAKILARGGAWYLAQKDYDRAYTSLSRASEQLEKKLGFLHPDTAGALDNLARVYIAQNKPAAAIDILKKSVDSRDRHAARIFGFVSEMQKLRTMDKLRPQTDLTLRLARSLPHDEQAVRLALTTVLRRKGRVLDGMAMSRAALRDANSPDEMVLMDQIISLQRQIVALIIRGPQGRSSEEHQAIIRELDAQKQMLEAQESRMSQRRLLQENPVTIDEVAAALPKGSALVEYALVRNSDTSDAMSYVAWVVFPDATVEFVDLGDARAIDEVVTEARNTWSEPKKDPKPAARKLDELILRPLRRAIGKTPWVFVSPDGDLNLVPFAALRDESQHWLIDAYSFTYLTSGRDLLLGETIDEPAEPGLPAVFFGNPDFGEKKLGKRRFAQRDNEAPARGARATDMSRIKFTPLMGTAQEISVIEKKVPGAQTFVADKATEAELKAVKHPRILHLATHGFFLPDKPSASHPDEDAAAFRTDNPLVRAGVALSGANLLRSGDEDGVLTAFEAAGLDLYGTKLVVLSACETGVGQARSGEGVYGLRRALAMAGAETLVMSLWPVDDVGTRDLMAGYYDRLMAGGGRVESLRQAALEIKSRPEYEHPNYWASFIASGDGTTLSGKQIPPGPPAVIRGPRGCACVIHEESNSDIPYSGLMLTGMAMAFVRVSRRRASVCKS